MQPEEQHNHSLHHSITPSLHYSNLNLEGIAWAIVGGESGPGARPIPESWALDIRDQCQKAGVAFYFKQWGGVFKKRNGRLLEGRAWDEMPATPVTSASNPQLELVPS